MHLETLGYNCISIQIVTNKTYPKLCTTVVLQNCFYVLWRSEEHCEPKNLLKDVAIINTNIILHQQDKYGHKVLEKLLYNDYGQT